MFFLFLCVFSVQMQAGTTAYYSSWSIYHKKYPLYARDLPLSLVSTLLYSFIDVDNRGNLSAPTDEEELANFKDFIALKEKATQPLTLLFSVGGWGEGSDPFRVITASSQARKHFIQQAIAFCKKYHFDGIDLDWEFPEKKAEGKNFALLLKELFTACKQQRPPLLVTAALSAHPSQYKYLPFSTFSSFLDRVHLMTYTFHGPWHDPENEVTNHQSALYITRVGEPLLNINSALEIYQQYFPKEKLFVGVPLFFTTYADATNGEPGSHYASSYSGPGKNPNEPDVLGELLYKEVRQDLERGVASGFLDEQAMAFSVYYSQQHMFGSGMNDVTLKEIKKYIEEHEYGGAMIWEIRGDSNDWNALRTLQTNS